MLLILFAVDESRPSGTGSGTASGTEVAVPTNIVGMLH